MSAGSAAGQANAGSAAGQASAAQRPVSDARRRLESGLDQLGGAAILTWKVFTRGLKRPWDLGSIAYQIEHIGVRSTSIGTLTSIFAGMVLAVQFGYFLEMFGIAYTIGRVLSLSVLRELGPVLTALTVGGRVGSGIAAELGSMQVTEQIDAIRALGADPVKKLVVPRVAAAMICLPIITVFADIVGLVAGAVIANSSYGIGYSSFFREALAVVRLNDFTSGIFKAMVFGLLIAIVGCFKGFRTSGGTEGVGRATTETVAISAIGVLVTDFFLTKLLLSL
ncbi:MlaE family ABC transporter permease [Vulgatibacter incomptus]|uniref:ABC-type transport system involved in resistance to organic solvent, permease component n=1 Tax=Vulgatibacter incomptus TaxID=1391653 RepID=A0A0K1PAF0_9BACT|nr:ABC transporter permease [Vulgatibacter incomptus]AKU90513.1 ABC-type transport system involved in resistance to organic solvent, permease component [Vulgatibacter incomptus]